MSVVASIRSRQDSDRPKNVAAVYEKYADLLGLLRRSKERAGDDFSPFAEVQLALVEEVVLDTMIALWSTDGHGRPLGPPVRLVIKRRTIPIPGQGKLFEREEAA